MVGSVKRSAQSCRLFNTRCVLPPGTTACGLAACLPSPAARRLWNEGTDQPSFFDRAYWLSANDLQGQYYSPAPKWWRGTCQPNQDGTSFPCKCVAVLSAVQQSNALDRGCVCLALCGVTAVRLGRHLMGSRSGLLPAWQPLATEAIHILAVPLLMPCCLATAAVAVAVGRPQQQSHRLQVVCRQLCGLLWWPA